MTPCRKAAGTDTGWDSQDFWIGLKVLWGEVKTGTTRPHRGPSGDAVCRRVGFSLLLVLSSRHSWPWWVLGGLLAEGFSNVLWFHSPLPVGFLLYTGNALGVAAGAWLVNWTCRWLVAGNLGGSLDWSYWALQLASVCGGGQCDTWVVWLQSFARALSLWWIGDATGVLILAPLGLLCSRIGAVRLSSGRAMDGSWRPGADLSGVAVLSLSGSSLRLLIMPPLLWAAVRFEFQAPPSP